MREKCRRGPALGKASLAKASESEGPEARLRSPADREVPRGAGTNPVSTDSPPRGSPMYVQRAHTTQASREAQLSPRRVATRPGVAVSLCSQSNSETASSDLES
ncbi:hypothetical protein PGT21_023335 [Puccinia graminis f. sp. tritici]|uniref:Uncharacterized protein n=1 Tax=Puccinia graminis f. sp. tritici TaxID=56615 RepID=A0A5B0QH00_PUCGR|nr:hypothetical protein PGT21_023335 [Puccinia graminis f. sp. tritici]KAA1112461.1 hypothetical protein PGTUg99_013642 [Puccinia graminis f. sp. tritici]